MNIIILILTIIIICKIVKRLKRNNAIREQRKAQAELAQASAHLRAVQSQIRMSKQQEKEYQRELRKLKADDLKHSQAVADLEYLEQARRTVITLYGVAEAEFNNAVTDRKKEIALKRMLGYDTKLRKLDKDRERAALIASTYRMV